MKKGKWTFSHDEHVRNEDIVENLIPSSRTSSCAAYMFIKFLSFQKVCVGGRGRERERERERERGGRERGGGGGVERSRGWKG